jgi:uncharacterized protein YkwD
MVHKPIALMILPIFVTGILTLGILAATANAQESNSTGNVAPPQASSNSTGNVAPPQASSNSTGNGPMSQENNSTGNVAPPQTSSNSTGNGPVSQQSSNTRNLRSGPCPYNENITCDNPEPVNNTNTTSTPYVVNKNSSAYLTGYNDAISYSNGACGSLPNTTQVQNDCGNGYVDGIYKVGDPTFQQSADFVKGMLAAHNRERAAVGLPPLVWNDNLAAGAKAWAEHLSPTGELVHDYGNVQGENIANNIANGPREWINEKNCAPNGCERGHYLGMVNPSFTSVGCGTAANPHDIVVCRYSKGIVNP